MPGVARASAADSKPAPPPDPGPLKPGEILDYSANVSSLNNVASLRLQIASHTDFLGKPAWHLQAFAHTQNPLRMVFELDDQFDSRSDVANLTGLQYEMHLSERGQKVEAILRLLLSPNESAPPGVVAARVVPGTRDPLGMLFYLRGIDWTKMREVRSPVYDGRKLYDVHAGIVGREEPVKVTAGSYTASKIEIHVLENGVEMKDAHFLLYLASDVARTPVLMEAVLPVATVRVELTKSK